MYAQLGDIIYKGVLSFTGFDRDRSANYAEHELINDVPRLQKIGLRKLIEITLTFHFGVAFCDPEIETENLVTKMYNGEILPLIDGSGKSLGDFVILRVKDTPKQTSPIDGKITDTEVTLELKEYVRPKKFGVQTTGFALSSTTPNLVNQTSKTQDPMAEMMKQQTIVSGQTAIVGDSVSAASKQPTKSASLYSQALMSVKKIQTAYGTMYSRAEDASRKLFALQAKFTNTLQSIQNAQNGIARIKNAILNANKNVENAKIALQAALANPGDPNSITNAIQASNDLTAAHRNVRGAGSETAYLTGAKKGWN